MRPIVINLDIISGICQKTCVHCVVPYMSSSNYMTLEDIVEFLNLNENTNIGVVMIPMGEPLLHPKFFDILGLINDSSIPFNFLSTNLGDVELSQFQVSQLVKIKQIQVDISENKQTEEVIDLVKLNHSNIKNYIEKNKSSCVLEAKRIYNPDLPEHPAIEGARTLPYVKHDYIEVFNNIANDGQKALTKYRERLGFSFNPSDHMMRLSYDHSKNKKMPCIPSQFNVLYDGSVNPCSSIIGETSKIDIGNAFKLPIKQILASNKATVSLNKMSNGELIPGTCEHCTYPNN